MKEFDNYDGFFYIKIVVYRRRSAIKQETQQIRKIYWVILVLEAGLEPAQPQWPRDFKSLVSTDSTIRASSMERAENETRTRDPNLGKVMLYQLSYFRISFNGCKDM